MPRLDTPGASLLYSRAGTGPPVLLIQGVGVVGNGWAPQVERLRERFTLVSFDNRGIGASVIRDGRLTIDDMAADALAIIDAEGIDRVHVARHSMGGVRPTRCSPNTGRGRNGCRGDVSFPRRDPHHPRPVSA
jgi:3-oxoadipate enol-lactonase